MIALRVLMAGVLAAGAVALTDGSVAQARPLTPMPTQQVAEPDDLPCGADGCQPPEVAPKPIRGVLGCVRGVCIPKPSRPQPKH